MSRGLLEADIYVEDLALTTGLTIEVSEDICETFFLNHDQSLEAAERMENIVDGRCEEPFVIKEDQGTLCIEKFDWMKVRIVVNTLSVIVDRWGVREIAHDLRIIQEADE